MTDDSVPNICTHRQVYELATDIASEFENIVDTCGIELLNPVVIKVIRVLEHLETSVVKSESLKTDIADLKQQNLQLQAKKNVCETERIKLEQDLEELQVSADKESKELEVVILKLREDNKRLQASLQEYITSQVDKDSSSEQCLITSLTNTVVLLNAKLEEKDSKLLELTQSIARLQLAVKELTNANRALCCKICEAQKRIQHFHSDESDLRGQILEQKEMLTTLRQCLNEATQQKLDLEESISLNQSPTTSLLTDELSTSPFRTPPEELDEQMFQERETFLSKIAKLERELFLAKVESESFKNRYLELQSIHSRESSMKRSYSIRQLFHFVLGVVVPKSENFRCF